MKTLFVFLVVALLTISACTQADKTATANKALAQRFVEEVWNKGNLDVVDELCAADYVRHNPNSWDPSVVEGAEAFKQLVSEVRTNYTDFHVTLEDIVVEGDMVATRWTATGAQKETNKQITFNGIGLTRTTEGKMVEEWISWDTYNVMQQLGMVAEPETTMK
ncbi:MAG: ester cyclase [bacterium]